MCVCVCVALVGGGDVQLPAFAPLLRGNAKRSECLRQRCCDRACKFRSDAEKQKLDELEKKEDKAGVSDPEREIEPDDREVKDDGAWPEEEEEGQGQGLASAADFEDAPKRDYLIDLYPFSRPENFYSGLYGMVGISGTQSVVIISATAHPASSIAGRAANVPVHVLLDRPAEHSVRHGQARAEHENFGVFLHCVCVRVCLRVCVSVSVSVCLRFAQSPVSDHSMPGQELALQRFRQISVAEGVGKNIKKRLRSDDIPLIEGPTVDSSCIMELTDFSAPDGSAMAGEVFVGLDSVPEDLEHKVPRQVQSDLEKYQLSLTTGPEGRGLVTRRPLKEGDEVCACPCIFLTSTAKLTAFLSKPAHACLATSVVRLKNVPMYGQRQELFCVLTGAARFTQNLTAGKRRAANVQLVFDPMAGRVQVVTDSLEDGG